MGRKPSVAWLFWVRNFGFTSTRKYAFLHSTWEAIIARRTGTTHSILDYVVYRLFYVLILCGVEVYKLSQVSPLPFLIYFETWSIFMHTVYSFLFLRQVLVHNHHRKALGRRQKLPDQLVIMDEIERDGHKYYISKKISILPKENLSAYEKLVWVMFNISSTLSFVNLIVTTEWSRSNKGSLLDRNHPKGMLASTTLSHSLVMLGFIMSFVDIFVNNVPMRLGHFIYSTLFCLMYFLMAYLYDTSKPGKIHLYVKDIWDKPTNLYILGIVVPCHISILLLSRLRDFVVSLLDRSRTAANQQKVRTQKRLARRKLMVPIYGPDGKVNRIVLEYGNTTAEDWIYWKDGHHGDNNSNWAGDDSDDGIQVEITHPEIFQEVQVMVEADEDELESDADVNEASIVDEVNVEVEEPTPILTKQKKYGPPPDLTATMDVKPVIKDKYPKRIEEIRLPSPPKKNPKPTAKVAPEPETLEKIKNATQTPQQLPPLKNQSPPKRYVKPPALQMGTIQIAPIEIAEQPAAANIIKTPLAEPQRKVKPPTRPAPRSPPTPPRQANVNNVKTNAGIVKNEKDEQIKEDVEGKDTTQLLPPLKDQSPPKRYVKPPILDLQKGPIHIAEQPTATKTIIKISSAEPQRKIKPLPRSPPTPPRQTNVETNVVGIEKNEEDEKIKEEVEGNDKPPEVVVLDKMGETALMSAFRRQYQAKMKKGLKLNHPTLIDPRNKPESRKGDEVQGDTDLEVERKKYAKHHKAHEIDRMVQDHDKLLKDVMVGVGGERKKQVHQEAEGPPKRPGVGKNVTSPKGILKATPQHEARRGSMGHDVDMMEGGNVPEERLPRKRRQGGHSGRSKYVEKLDPVYDPVIAPNIPNSTTSFHFLDTKLDKRGKHGKLQPEQVLQLRKHPGFPLVRTEEGINTTATKGRPPVKEKESAIAFHPVIQLFDVPANPQSPPHGKTKSQNKNKEAMKKPNPNLHKFDHFQPDTQFTGHPPPEKDDDDDVQTRIGRSRTRTRQ